MSMTNIGLNMWLSGSQSDSTIGNGNRAEIYFESTVEHAERTTPIVVSAGVTVVGDTGLEPVTSTV